MHYTAILDGELGAYGVVFPDLPGCTAMGSTIDGALANGADAVRDWVDVIEETGAEVPAPRSADSLRRDPDVASALAEGASLATITLFRETAR